MDTTELLEILNGIFRKVLKRDDITLTESTTAHDVDGWDSLTNMVLITDCLLYTSPSPRDRG